METVENLLTRVEIVTKSFTFYTKIKWTFWIFNFLVNASCKKIDIEIDLHIKKLVWQFDFRSTVKTWFRDKLGHIRFLQLSQNSFKKYTFYQFFLNNPRMWNLSNWFLISFDHFCSFLINLISSTPWKKGYESKFLSNF